MLIFSLLATVATPLPFPEKTPALVKACLEQAVVAKSVYRTKGDWKYVCGGDEARALWSYLTELNQESWEQVVDRETWLSREFPLGACFTRVKDAAGRPVATGLSCTIWIPKS